MTTVITQSSPTDAPRPRPAGPNPWLVIGGVVTALLLAAGILNAVGWLNYRTEVQQTVYVQTAESISIEIAAGDVTLVPGEPGQISVTRRLHWSYEKPTYSERWDGTTFRVSAGCDLSWLSPNCGVDYTLAVPVGVNVYARVGTGDLTASGIQGQLTFEASTGDIDVVGGEGTLLLHTSTGDIHVSATSHHVDASTSTGDISLDLLDTPSAVFARTSTGDIHITVPESTAYQVQAETSTGDIRVEVDNDDHAQSAITARTSTGDIEIKYGQRLSSADTVD